MRKSTFWLITLLMILGMVLVACGGDAGDEPAAEGLVKKQPPKKRW